MIESQPHVLRLMPATSGRWLACTNGGWETVDSIEDAFVFPSPRLATRFAQVLPEPAGLHWALETDPGRLPTVVGTPSCRVCGCTESFACPGRCHWTEPDLCSACLAESPPIRAWAIYQRPLEYREGYLARLYYNAVATMSTCRGPTLDAVRAQLPKGLGLVAVHRADEDDPALVETWL